MRQSKQIKTQKTKWDNKKQRKTKNNQEEWDDQMTCYNRMRTSKLASKTKWDKQDWIRKTRQMSSAEMVWDKKDRIRHTGQSETIKTKKKYRVGQAE